MSDKIISEEDYNQKGAWGLLTSIDLFECEGEILRDKEKIKNFVISLCELIDMKRFGEPIIVRFGKGKVKGYSLMQLIETSSITGHFAEESNSVYIDIFSCKFYDQEKTINFVKNFFKAKKFKFSVLLRG